MKTQMALLIVAGFLLGPSPVHGQGDVRIPQLGGYLEKMGLPFAQHPQNKNTLVVTRSSNEQADRIDLYIEVAKDRTLVLTAYPRVKSGYFNLSRATSRARLLQRLMSANHRAFATFFSDEQGDIGARFTFTTENGVGFESFKVAVSELLRIADQYTPILDDLMRKK